jgi:hypothetical protein
MKEILIYLYILATVVIYVAAIVLFYKWYLFNKKNNPFK